jgi:hypothetical protein
MTDQAYRETAGSKVLRTLNNVLSKVGFRLTPDDGRDDVYLHTYDSYDQYKASQVFHNKRKLDNVWADAATLDLVAARARQVCLEGPVRGLCHGARNGFEQRYFNQAHPGFTVIGTDISETAAQFPDSVVWDFHDPNPDWVQAFDFVYSNSLDQGWQPRAALRTWLNQTRDGGLVVVEHTADHGPSAASDMDPFGVRPQVFPYVVAQWFGHQVTCEIITGRKSNNQRDVWLFVLRRTGGLLP